MIDGVRLTPEGSVPVLQKTIHNPSLVQDLSALAGLYRTVFWMMGRKIQYGQVWPDEGHITLNPFEVAGEGANGASADRDLVAGRR